MKQIDRSQIVYQDNHYKPPSDLILRQVPLGGSPCLEMDPTYSTAGVRTFEVCARSENEWLFRQRGLERDSSTASTKYHRDRHHTKYHHSLVRKKNLSDRYVLVVGKPVRNLPGKTYKRILRRVTDDGTAEDFSDSSAKTDDRFTRTKCTCFGRPYADEEPNHHHKSTAQPRHKKGGSRHKSSKNRIERNSISEEKNLPSAHSKPKQNSLISVRPDEKRPRSTKQRGVSDHEELPVVTNHYFHHFPNLPARNTNPFQTKSSIPVHKIIIQNSGRQNSIYHYPAAARSGQIHPADNLAIAGIDVRDVR